MRKSGALLLVGALTLVTRPEAVLGPGHVTYSLSNGTVYRILAEPGAKPEPVSLELNKLSRGGGDQDLNISPDGHFLVLSTQRFGCAGWACLAVVAGNLSSGAALKIAGQAVHPEGIAAIASGGNLVVYALSGGPHREDLWATSRQSGGAWAEPVLLTKSSPEQYNQSPAISRDGRTVVFECGGDPYAQTDTPTCLVTTSGRGHVTVVFHGPRTEADQQPAFEPDGSIVFERQRTTSTGSSDERIWRLPAGSNQIKLVSPVSNDNSPCALPDGRIVSLWLNRPGNRNGLHELKVMNEDGSGARMLVENVDIDDIGTGCGG